MDPICFEDFDLDASGYRLRRSGQDLKLERIPLELLLVLAGAARRTRYARGNCRKALGQRCPPRYRECD